MPGRYVVWLHAFLETECLEELVVLSQVLGSSPEMRLA